MDCAPLRFVSCSSEAADCSGADLCASNSDKASPWRTAAPEKRASLEIELLHPGRIVGVDVGVYGAAFLEIKVSGKEKGLDNFTPLLGTMNCRSMKEVKDGTNVIKEFVLRQERFMRSVAASETTRIQFSLTQPYSPPDQIGLTHIRIYAATETSLPLAPILAKPAAAQPQTAPTLPTETVEAKKPVRVLPPSFATKPNKPLAFETGSTSTESVEIVKPEENKEQNKPIVASVPKATIPTQLSPQKALVKPPAIKENIPVASLASHNTQLKQQPQQAHHSQQPQQKSMPTNSGNTIQTKPPSTAPTQAQPQGASQGNTQSQGSTRTPYNKILHDVVITISGIGNPERSELRRIAKEMGADYRPDWADDSTHLICEFFGTAKQKQASSAGGKVVKKSWIYECSKQGMRLSEHSFSFDYKKSPPKLPPQPQQPPQGVKSLLQQARQPPNPTQHKQSDVVAKISSLPPTMAAKSSQPPQSTAKFIDNDSLDNRMIDDEDADTLDRIALQEAASFVGKMTHGQRSARAKQVNYRDDLGSDDDTPKAPVHKKPKSDPEDDDDDGWAALVSRGEKNPKSSPQKKSLEDNDWGIGSAKKTPISKAELSDTEDESDQEKSSPTFFSDCSIYFHKLAEDERKQLCRSVISNGGAVRTTLDDSVTHIITNRQWEESYDVVLQDNPDLRILRPSWVHACIKAAALLPPGQHVVVPK